MSPAVKSVLDSLEKFYTWEPPRRKWWHAIHVDDLPPSMGNAEDLYNVIKEFEERITRLEEKNRNS